MKVGYDLTLRHRLPARAALRLSVLARRGGSGPQLERLGLDHHAGRHTCRPAACRCSSAPSSCSRGSRRSDSGHPLGVWVAQHRDQRHDPLAEPDLQPRAAGQQRHALRPGLARGQLGDADRLPRRGRQQVRDVRPAVQQDAAAAGERDVGIQWPRHGLRQLCALPPGGQLAAARGRLGPQPGGRR